MRERIVSILLRVKIQPGEKRYYPAIVNSNGTIKPFCCRIAGQEVHRSDGIYYLRYTDYYRKGCTGTSVKIPNSCEPCNCSASTSLLAR